MKYLIVVAGLAIVVVLVVWWVIGAEAESGGARVPDGPGGPAIATGDATRTPTPVGGAGAVRIGVEAAADDRDPTPTLRGRVAFPDGRPAPDVAVFAGAETWPFTSEPGGPGGIRRVERDGLLGTVLGSDADGRFEVEVRAGSGLWVLLSERDVAPHRPCPGSARVFVPSVDEVVSLCVEKAGVATLVVRAVDTLDGSALETFRVALDVGAGATFEDREVVVVERVDDGELRRSFPIASPSGALVSARLVEDPRADETPTQAVLHAGRETVVVLRVGSDTLARGTVTTEDGRPVEGAVVFFGVPADGRPDQPFRTFDPARVPHGTTTDADGWFELAGSGEIVTAWHPDLTPGSVPAAPTVRIVLGDRGRITGTLPADRRATPVHLDDRAPVDVAQDGAFRIDGVDAGVHGLWVGETVIGVELAAGEDLHVGLDELHRGVVLDVTGAGAEPRQGALLGGTSRAFTVVPLTVADGRIVVDGVLPGPHLLALEGGGLRRIDLSEPSEHAVRFGMLSVTVRSSRARRVAIVPAGASDFVRRMCARLDARSVDAGGEVRFPRLEPGTYAVWDVDAGLEREVAVDGRETVVRM